MRLGVVGMLPADFRSINADHLAAIRALDLTGAGFHAGPELLAQVTRADCRQVQQRFAAAGMDLVQFGIGFSECLFDPAAAVRDQVVAKIARGIEVGRDLGAGVTLIRTGSLSPRGSYSPSPKNLTADARTLLHETLGRVAAKAEAEGVTIVVETHVLTIMNSPETNREVVATVGSDQIRIVMDYVNHFQSLHQVYNSTQRINQIFDVMGPLCPVGHCKDIQVGEGFVVHFSEEIPGEGELDLGTALRRWHSMAPNGYMLLEHLPNEKYPLASRNTHRIAAAAGVEIH